jgi:2-polyprenyl-3-methyl-5-hydroxy-6-metoxy-1,4-benzoquinol methylase
MNIGRNDILKALERSYNTLSPFSDTQKWEIDSNVFHIASIVKNTSVSESILDVGCGIGILALTLKYLGYNVSGIDKYVFEPINSYSVSDIEGLRRIWDKEGLSISPYDVLKNGEIETYDVVLSIAVIEHQKDLKKFIGGISKYAKKGGKIYIATPNATNLLNRFRVLCGKPPMANIDQFLNEGENFNGHWREYTVSELRRIATLSNIEIIESGNRQTTKAKLTTNYKKWHTNILRLVSTVLPGTGDTNYIWLKK